MSKYAALWEYVSGRGPDYLKLSFEEIERIAGTAVDHSFLTYKKELTEYGFKTGKISLKGKTVEFFRERKD